MSRELKEKSIRWLLTGVAFVSLLSLACIMLFLFMEGLPLFADYPLWDFLTGHLWYPTSEPPEFGIFPLIMGSLAVTILASCIAVPLGIVAATKQYSVTDYTVTTVALLGMSLPTFFFATLLKLIFCIKLGWFDLVGLTGRDFNSLSQFGQILDMAKHLVLPIVTLVFISIGPWMRYVRTNMLEVLNADYIRTARAKGLSEHKVIYHHAFRNTLIPLVTFIGGSLPGLFAGALITETLFAIPGIGFTSYNAMVAGDIPFSMFYMTFLAILTLLGNLISDILYAVVDPRVRIA